MTGGKEPSSCSTRASSRTLGPRSSSAHRVAYSPLCLLFHLLPLTFKPRLSHSVPRATPGAHAGHLVGSPTSLAVIPHTSLPGRSAPQPLYPWSVPSTPHESFHDCTAFRANYTPKTHHTEAWYTTRFPRSSSGMQYCQECKRACICEVHHSVFPIQHLFYALHTII